MFAVLGSRAGRQGQKGDLDLSDAVPDPQPSCPHQDLFTDHVSQAPW